MTDICGGPEMRIVNALMNTVVNGVGSGVAIQRGHPAFPRFAT
jgi:hypothetical protein